MPVFLNRLTIFETMKFRSFTLKKTFISDFFVSQKKYLKQNWGNNFIPLVLWIEKKT